MTLVIHWSSYLAQLIRNLWSRPSVLLLMVVALWLKVETVLLLNAAPWKIWRFQILWLALKIVLLLRANPWRAWKTQILRVKRETMLFIGAHPWRACQDVDHYALGSDGQTLDEVFTWLKFQTLGTAAPLGCCSVQDAAIGLFATAALFLTWKPKRCEKTAFGPFHQMLMLPVLFHVEVTHRWSHVCPGLVFLFGPCTFPLPVRGRDLHTPQPLKHTQRHVLWQLTGRKKWLSICLTRWHWSAQSTRPLQPSNPNLHGKPAVLGKAHHRIPTTDTEIQNFSVATYWRNALSSHDHMNEMGSPNLDRINWIKWLLHHILKTHLQRIQAETTARSKSRVGGRAVASHDAGWVIFW